MVSGARILPFQRRAMAVDLAVPLPKAEDLPPPPRLVPLRLWCHLLAGPATLFGAAFFAFGMIFALIFGRATDPVGLWRLSQRCQRTPGRLVTVEATSFSEGGGDGPGTPIFRCDYTFTLPDGTPMRGSSYTLGEQYKLPAGAPPLPVTVEYDPDHPATNRIQGTRTSPYPPWVLFVLLFPAMGLLIALVGLAVGRNRGRLLRDGEVAAATVTACRLGTTEGNDPYLSPAEYKHRLACWSVAPLGRGIQAFGIAFLVLWTVLATAILVFGVVVCLVILGMLFVLPGPVPHRALFGLGVGGFLVVWLLLGGFMVRSGWRGLRSARQGNVAPPGSEPGAARQPRSVPAPPRPLGFAFEFRLPDGTAVQGKGPGRLVGGPDGEPPQPVLYDPSRPKNALLLSALMPALRLGPYGAWETTAGIGAYLRVLVVLLLLGGPFVVWVLLP
jgi:hypothetical protein